MLKCLQTTWRKICQPQGSGNSELYALERLSTCVLPTQELPTDQERIAQPVPYSRRRCEIRAHEHLLRRRIHLRNVTVAPLKWATWAEGMHPEAAQCWAELQNTGIGISTNFRRGNNVEMLGGLSITVLHALSSMYQQCNRLEY